VRKGWDPRGFSLVEVLLAAGILAIGLLGVMAAFPTSYLAVVGSGGQSKAGSYARQQIERLKNQPFDPGPTNGTLAGLDPRFTGTFTITPIAGTAAPNRLVRISVTATFGGGGDRAQAVTLETMRSE
jgi:prepilin-type N-terminal cleavage/methylation domain-containing protein